MGKCSYCNELIDPNELFCNSCGAKVVQSNPSNNYSDGVNHNTESGDGASEEQQTDPNHLIPIVVCDSCKQSIAPGSQYCPKCGKALKALVHSKKSTTSSKREGFLILPDKSEIQITPTQRLLGRVDLAKYVLPQDANTISRAHVTIYKDESDFYIVDGKTAVQHTPSSNRTSVLTNGIKTEITQNGPYQLKNGDEIMIADLVRIRFENREV